MAVGGAIHTDERPEFYVLCRNCGHRMDDNYIRRKCSQCGISEENAELVEKNGRASNGQ